MDNLYQLEATFFGNVQGVFFREFSKKYALELDITGYAKNQEDGSVKIIAVCEKEKLEFFLKKIEEKPGYRKITKIEKKISKSKNQFNSFEIY